MAEWGPRSAGISWDQLRQNYDRSPHSLKWWKISKGTATKHGGNGDNGGPYKTQQPMARSGYGWDMVGRARLCLNVYGAIYVDLSNQI